MANFEKAFEKVLKFEGGYVNDPVDRGGETNWGITKKVARNAGYRGEMKDLTVEDAKKIYRQNYWSIIKLDQIKDDSIAIKAFDIAVNMGTGTAIRLLQKAYNILNQETITVDGIVGPQTLSAINNYKHKKDLFHLLNVLQARRYIKIVENDESQKRFIRGWLKRTQMKIEE